MGHGGLLVANDASASRSRALIRNLEMAGVKNAVVLNEQPNRLAEYFPAFFDRVLVDAPCSGEGMFRRDKDAAKTSAANKPAACAKTQREILRHSAAMLKPGGRLVYSTCTFNKQENEDIIEAFLLNHKEFSVLSVDHSSLGVSTGFDPLRETARIWPHRSPGEGHFIALLEKRDNEKDGVQIPSPSKKTTSPAVKFVPRTARTAYESFCEAAFRNKPRGLYQLHKKALCRVPEGIPDLSGLRIARGGWYLGDVSKERFTPSQAMAMAMSVKEARHGLNLSKSDALLYIKGHSFIPENNYTPESGKPWILVGYKGFPLGWARWKDGRLINRLPGSWVMR
jgi:NOL1/NOP2/fmu family ribosome biogenesis protein/precorrin-6B methylase 2